MKFLCSENGNPGISQIRRRRKTFRQTNTNRESTASYIAPASATNMSSAHFCPQHFKHRLRGCCGTTRAGQRHLNVEAAEDDGAPHRQNPTAWSKSWWHPEEGPPILFKARTKNNFLHAAACGTRTDATAGAKTFGFYGCMKIWQLSSFTWCPRAVPARQTMSKADFLHCQASETLKVVSSHFATSFSSKCRILKQ